MCTFVLPADSLTYDGVYLCLPCICSVYTVCASGWRGEGFYMEVVCVCEAHKVSGSDHCSAVLLNAQRQESNKHTECSVTTVYTDHTSSLSGSVLGLNISLSTLVVALTQAIK